MKKLILFLAIVLVTPTVHAYWYAIEEGSTACNIVNVERSNVAAKMHNKPYSVFKTHTAFKEYLQGLLAACDLSAKVVNPAPTPEPVVLTDEDCAPLIANGTGDACIAPPEPIPDMGNMPMVDTSLNTPPATGSGTLDIKTTTGKPAANDGGGQFRVQCGFSHMLNDDPIVFPNRQGASHHHTFYGNTSINAFSDLDNLQDTGDSTCFGGTANRSAYWHPSLIDTNTGKAIPANFALFYYKTGRPNLVAPPPKGLRIIAGNAHATSSQWPNSWTRYVRWGCNSDGIIRDSIPACNGQLSIYIEFPSCWDGVNLDSPDHKSHMAYPNNGNCPASHPVVIPTITENAKFDVNTGMNIRLSSDNYSDGNGGYSLHADWVNGWNPDVMNTIVNNCLKKAVDCHANLLGNGQQLYDKFGQWEKNAVNVPLKK